MERRRGEAARVSGIVGLSLSIGVGVDLPSAKIACQELIILFIVR